MALVVLATGAGCGALIGFGPERELGEGGAGGVVVEGGGGAVPRPAHHCNPGDDVEWVRVFGNSAFDMIYRLGGDGADGVYVGAWFEGTYDLGAGPMVALGGTDFAIARLDSEGEVLWVRHQGTPESDEAPPEFAAHPMGVAVCGTSKTATDFGNGLHVADGHDNYVVLLDEQGDPIWETWLGGPGEQRCWGGPTVDPTNGDVIVGSLFGEQAEVGGEVVMGDANGEILITRLRASDGAVLSHRAFVGGGVDRVNEVVALADGSVAFAGVVHGTLDLGDGSGPVTTDEADVLVARLSADLQSTLWGHLVAGPGHAHGWGLAALADGDLLLSGELDGSMDLGDGPIADAGGGFIARLSAEDGLAVVSRSLDGFERPSTVLEAPSGEIFVAGGFSGTTSLGGSSTAVGEERDAVVVKLSADLSEVHWKQVATSSMHGESFTGMALSGDSLILGGVYFESLDVDGCPSYPAMGDVDGFLMRRVQ